MKKIIVLVLGLLFIHCGVYAEGGYESINVDDHFIRIEIEDTSFPADTTKSFEFTPELSGRYALFFGGVNNNGGTTNMTVSISEDGIPADIIYRNLIVSGSSITADADNPVLTEASYTHTRKSVSGAQYERVGDYRAVYTELEKDTTYTLSVNLTGTASILKYIDIRRIDIDIKGEDTIISPHDFYDMTSWRKFSVNSEMPWLPMPQWPEEYNITGDYKSDLLTETRDKTTVTRGGYHSFSLNFKRPGKYKIGVYGHSASGNAGTNVMWNGTYKTHLSYTDSATETKWTSEIEITKPGTHVLGFQPGQHMRFFSIIVDFIEPLEEVMECGISYDDTTVTGSYYIENNKSDAQEQNMFIILATYDENNIMNGIEMKPVVFVPGTPLDDKISIFNSDWDTARMYLWDGTSIEDAGEIIYSDVIVCEK